jgi:hypothetical protein
MLKRIVQRKYLLLTILITIKSNLLQTKIKEEAKEILNKNCQLRDLEINY